MIGQTISHYKVSGKIGEGGMGIVYKAEDTKLNRPVALKFLAAHLLRDEESRKRFEREAKAAAALNHPNICTIHEIDEVDGGTFLALEFIEGESLQKKIERGPLPFQEALDFARQIADGLQAAHQKGVVHRDIKPGNVIITPENRAKILDFGLALLTEGSKLTQFDTALGTIAYMSPEQTMAAGTDDRTDIWALGVVLYEMVSGQRPFRGDYDQAVVYSITNEQPEPLTGLRTGVPMELERIVGKCLAKDAAQRFQRADELLVDLDTLREKIKSGKSKPLPPVATVKTGVAAGAAPASAGAPAAAEPPHAPAEQTVASGPAASRAAAPAEPAPALEPISGRERLAWVLCALASVVAIAALGSRYVGGGVSQLPAWRVLPLTTYPGEEVSPALSWDGERVAFAWDGEEKGNIDIYVRLIDGGSPVRLTDDPADDASPCWSPDGKQLAFTRGDGVYVVPSLGGQERRLARFEGEPNADNNTFYSPSLSWHPNGKMLVAATRKGIRAVDVSTGEVRELTSSLPPSRDRLPRISPDGRSLAFVRGSNPFSQQLFVAKLDKDLSSLDKAKPLADIFWGSGLSWFPDGTRLVYSAREGSRQLLWVLDVDGNEPAVLAVDTGGAWQPSFSQSTGQLAYHKQTEILDTWELPGPGPSGDPAQRDTSPRPLIVSSFRDFMAHFSADGSRIAFVSTRSGYQEIWRANGDGTGQIQLTNLGIHVGTSRWSPDGATIVFDGADQGQFDIFTIGAEGGAPGRLVSAPSNEHGPCYSPDGAWVLFMSDRTGEEQIWKVPSTGGDAIQVTRGGGYGPIVSSDGKFVFYRKRAPASTEVWKVPMDGGEENVVLTDHAGGQHHAVAGDSIYYLRNGVNGGSPRIAVRRLKTGETFDLWTLPEGKYIGGGNSISVSPDESRVIFQLAETVRGDLMLVDGLQ